MLCCFAISKYSSARNRFCPRLHLPTSTTSPMALPKPPIPLRTWPRVHCPQAQSTRLPICHNTLRNRPFHSTSLSSAAPSPAVQRARRAAVRRTAPFSKENLLLAPILDNARAVPLLQDFNRRAQIYWQVAREDNVLPQTLPYRDFLRVGGELIMRATEMPNERAVRSISTGSLSARMGRNNAD